MGNISKINGEFTNKIVAENLVDKASYSGGDRYHPSVAERIAFDEAQEMDDLDALRWQPTAFQQLLFGFNDGTHPHLISEDNDSDEPQKHRDSGEIFNPVVFECI